MISSKLSFRFTDRIGSLMEDVMLDSIAAPANMKANGEFEELEGADEGFSGEHKSITGGLDESSSVRASSITDCFTLSDSLGISSKGIRSKSLR